MLKRERLRFQSYHIFPLKHLGSGNSTVVHNRQDIQIQLCNANKCSH